MNRILKKIIITIFGTVLVIVGLVGWLMPVIPGFPLVIIGLPMMLALTPWAEKVKSVMNKIIENVKKRISAEQHSDNG